MLELRAEWEARRGALRQVRGACELRARVGEARLSHELSAGGKYVSRRAMHVRHWESYRRLADSFAELEKTALTILPAYREALNVWNQRGGDDAMAYEAAAYLDDAESPAEVLGCAGHLFRRRCDEGNATDCVRLHAWEGDVERLEALCLGAPRGDGWEWERAHPSPRRPPGAALPQHPATRACGYLTARAETEDGRQRWDEQACLSWSAINCAPPPFPPEIMQEMEEMQRQAEEQEREEREQRVQPVAP